MVDRDLVASKLGELAEHVARVRTRRVATAEDLRRDRDALDLVAFNLMLAVQACADVASHVIADEGWPPATSLGAAFERLRDKNVISAPVCEALIRAVGLRNVIAHGYAGVRPEMVHAAGTTGLADLEAFARDVAIWTQGQL
ncbi:MAG: DUF86 domain-containing protein [Candidatus Rokubacteria bacterium]|jgi:uncharacterized protein YutE (UPF0331/DUF86 family)|nr:DUF86 domain-containing protein [Candidatus Rokubacteria bacterium]